jgi:hypothetical protein
LVLAHASINVPKNRRAASSLAKRSLNRENAD